MTDSKDQTPTQKDSGETKRSNEQEIAKAACTMRDIQQAAKSPERQANRAAKPGTMMLNGGGSVKFTECD